MEFAVAEMVADVVPWWHEAKAVGISLRACHADLLLKFCSVAISPRQLGALKRKCKTHLWECDRGPCNHPFYAISTGSMAKYTAAADEAARAVREQGSLLECLVPANNLVREFLL